jgi:hypothetical protein
MKCYSRGANNRNTSPRGIIIHLGEWESVWQCFHKEYRAENIKGIQKRVCKEGNCIYENGGNLN